MSKRLLKLKIRFLNWRWNVMYKMLRAYGRDIQRMENSRDELITKIKLVQQDLNTAQEEWDNL